MRIESPSLVSIKGELSNRQNPPLGPYEFLRIEERAAKRVDVESEIIKFKVSSILTSKLGWMVDDAFFAFVRVINVGVFTLVAIRSFKTV